MQKIGGVSSVGGVTTASGGNRQNTQGIPLRSVTGRSTQTIANIIPAGGTLPVPLSGSFFYFTVLTANVDARPSGGVFSPYGQGQGLDVGLESSFSLLEIKNNNLFAVVFQVVAGYDGFIDNTLIINNTTGEVDIAVNVCGVVNSVNTFNILDKSGTKLADINGNQYYTLRRVSFTVSNADAAAVYSITNTAGTLTQCFVQPLTTIQLPNSGNFRMQEAGNINAVCFETYKAIPATLA